MISLKNQQNRLFINKKAQLTVIIIIGLVIIALVLTFLFIFKIIPLQGRNTNIMKFEAVFGECVKEKTLEAVKIAESQAGYINLPNLEQASSYMPFSSQLNFIGLKIPYWLYVSGNGIMKEQVPTKSEIEQQLNSYLDIKIKECSNIEYPFEVRFSNVPKTKATIKKQSIHISVNWPVLIIDKTNSTQTDYEFTVSSKFGELYDTALHILREEKSKAFLENYSVDVLRLYAPVDGIDLSCAPKVWQKAKVKQDIQEALTANIPQIKLKGTYYDNTNKYFIYNTGKTITNQVNFLYSSEWPIRFEIWPSDSNILKAEPVGTQQGLGILGFCYVPYHFVYDIYFPVLVQISSQQETFQFPLLVIIDKNMARKSISAQAPVPEIELDICKQASQQITIFSYFDNSPSEADIYFKCLNQICNLGKTEIKEGKAVLETKVPQCYNAFIIAESEKGKTQAMVTTNENLSINLFLEPVHQIKIEMDLASDERALINFIDLKDTNIEQSVYYPEKDTVELEEKEYQVSVLIFKNSPINLGSQQIEQCLKVPAAGIAGIFGVKSEECYDIEIPDQTITSVLFGGGKGNVTITGPEKLKIEIQKFSVPRNINELINIYSLVDLNELKIRKI